ncbi:XdhC family protein [Botrimarina hoheduenensis]|uniref:XdhC and CoxI family protein n=1 Tax=Botrimarina hoheduenensis TaxID=2528000 RepID=A0A5C5VVK0_9BACT|nr:XdhC family protein [Botrimarina hoheduenensis]TWT41631.1 XdhC and CoxI family protein [Botrimarina hoheduenensis]
MNASQRFISRFAERAVQGERLVLVTVVESNGTVGRGTKMLVGEHGRVQGHVGDGAVEQKAIGFARSMLESLRPPGPQLVEWHLDRNLGMPGEGTMTLFFDPQNTRPWRVYLFGAGHIGQRLARALLLMDCEVICIDSHREWVGLLPASLGLERLCRSEPADLAQRLEGDEFVVCATMGVETDYPILRAILSRDIEIPYLGVVGSKEKRRELAQRLVSDGMSKERALSFRCPIGVSIEGGEPGEIAIAIAAEMLAVRQQMIAQVLGRSSAIPGTAAS